MRVEDRKRSLWVTLEDSCALRRWKTFTSICSPNIFSLRVCTQAADGLCAAMATDDDDGCLMLNSLSIFSRFPPGFCVPVFPAKARPCSRLRTSLPGEGAHAPGLLGSRNPLGASRLGPRVSSELDRADRARPTASVCG